MKGEFSPRVLNCDIPTCSSTNEKKRAYFISDIQCSRMAGTAHTPQQHICGVALKHGLFNRKVGVFHYKPAEHCSVPQMLCSWSLRMQVACWNNVRRPQSTQQSKGCRPKSWQQLHHCWRWKQQLQIWGSCSALRGCTSMHWKSREYLSAPRRPTKCKLALFLRYKGWRYYRYQTVIATISASRSCSSALQEDTRHHSKKRRVNRLLL